MIERHVQYLIEKALKRQSAVVLIGPRQVGKTTLAKLVGQTIPSLYLDLESLADRSKLSDPKLFLEKHKNKLVILDEIHKMPEIFQELRGIIDEGRQTGYGVGRFLILGSAALDLLKQSGETLAGRVEYIHLNPLDIIETHETHKNKDVLWLRGGFPGSYLAHTEEDSLHFRAHFIRTFLERDISLFGPRMAIEKMGRLWMMLAHHQGCLLNASRFASSMDVSAPSITNYIDLLVDLLVVRRLQPFHINISKRLVKSPKIYIRDSGILHALLGITCFDDLLGHPVCGASWEGFVIENLLSVIPFHVRPSFYRTAVGAEIDLILEVGGREGLWAIEIKKGLSPKLEKGFQIACEDIKPTKSFVVYSGEERYPKTSNIEIISVHELSQEILNLSKNSFSSKNIFQ